jgi:DNA-binding MarR family transcriptional regulator
MSNIFEEIAGLDKLIHGPARLAIMTILSTSHSADFLALQRLTGLTSGNLSVHLSKLAGGELIIYEKQFVDNKPKTQIKITKKGQQVLEKHWLQLENFRANLQKLKPE